MTEKEKKFMIIVITKKRHESFGTLKTFTSISGCRSMQDRDMLNTARLSQDTRFVLR